MTHRQSILLFLSNKLGEKPPQYTYNDLLEIHLSLSNLFKFAAKDVANGWIQTLQYGLTFHKCKGKGDNNMETQKREDVKEMVSKLSKRLETTTEWLEKARAGRRNEAMRWSYCNGILRRHWEMDICTGHWKRKGGDT